MQTEIDTARVLSGLRTLARHGATGRGVTRPALSADDMAARQWLAEQMREAGLQVSIDAVGNVYGRSPGVQRAVLVGSHVDSVPNGGWLDGAMGVIYALETARAWLSQHAQQPVGIDVIAFSDEEGRYLSCLGSRSFCHALDGTSLDTLTHAGLRFTDAVRQAGLADRDSAHFDPVRHVAYVEAHIEQGPRLEQAGLDLGIVTGIAGMTRYQVSFAGRADHAGTTPMSMRQDAALAAFDFALSCERALREAAGPDSVWNFGALSLQPGAANVVARRAELTVEFRDLAQPVMQAMEAALLRTVASHDGQRQVRVSAQRQNTLPPAMMDDALQSLLTDKAVQRGASHMAMHSGAIHDAMLLARHVPTAMLFVPSIGGRSHCPEEDTAAHHIALGAQVFCDAVCEAALQAGRHGLSHEQAPDIRTA